MPEDLVAERRRELLDLLSSASTIPVADLVRRFDEEGLLGDLRQVAEDEDDLGDLVLDEIVTDEVWSTPGGVVASTAALVEGLTLTHRINEEELETQAVALVPDLVILDWEAHEGLTLEGTDGGGRVVVMADEVTGPDGWLSGFTAGDTVAFTRRGRTCAVRNASGLGDDTREVELLRSVVDPRIPQGQGEEAVPLILDALTADPTAFRHPVRPLGELLEDVGLERRGFSFGRRGQRWSTFSEAARVRMRGGIEARYGFDRCCRRALDEFLDAVGLISSGGDVDAVSTARALGHGEVVWAAAELLLHRWVDAPEVAAVGHLAATVGGRAEASPLRTFLALAAGTRGRADESEEHLRAAHRADPGYAPAAWELAEVELDRGNLDRAIALYGIGEEAPAALAPLRAFRTVILAPYDGVGRNDPCPCRSGRKFKVCCQREPKVPITQRSRLLIHKVATFLARAEHRTRLMGVASSACDPDDPQLARAIAERAADPVVFDLVLFEGGMVEEYLAERGHRLPPDEAALLDAMVHEPRRLWEVVAVDRGVGLRLRDTRTGDTVEVDEMSGSAGASVGELLLARVAPVADRHQVFGTPLSIPLRLRASAIELVDSHPDADALADWYGQALRSQTVVTRDGDPLMFRRALIFTGAPEGDVLDAFDELFEVDRRGRWVDLGDDGVVLGSITADDGGWVLETISDRRFDHLAARIRSVLPDADFEELDFDEDLDFEDDDLDEEDPFETSPEAQALLERFIREKEEEWVDESIPALGGLTPRQALDDPTRREDLFTLLREMEGAQPLPSTGARSFDPARLRELLGIEPPP